MPTLENLTDRELLIQNSLEIKNLCREFNEFKNDNAKEHELIFTKLDALMNGKVSNTLFYFTISVIITAILSLTAYTGVVKNEVVKNTTCIEQLGNKK